MNNFDTRRWLVATVAGFICLGVWLAASTADPAFVLAPEVKAALFAIALGALGLSQYTSYKAVSVVDDIIHYQPE